MTVSSAPMPEYFFLQGKNHYETGDLKKTEEAWSNLSRDALYGPVALMLLSRAYSKLGQLDKAESLLQQAIREHPSSVYINSLRAALVDILCEEGKPEVLPVLRNMKQRASEKDKPALTLRLAVLERRLGNFDTAAALYKDLFLNYPASVHGLRAAEDLATMVVQGKIPSPSLSESEQLSRAVRLVAKGRFDLAGSAYAALLKKKPSDKSLMLKLARCNYKDRKHQAAITMLKDIVKGEVPEDVRMEALYLLSQVYWRIDNAKGFESTNAQIVGKGPLRMKKRALFDQGAYYFEKSKFTEAKTCFENLLKMNVDSKTKVSVKWRLAWIKYLNKQYKEAADSFQEIRYILPAGKIQNASKYWQARSLLRLNRTKNAELILKQISASDPLGYYGFEAGDLLKQMKTGLEENVGVRNPFPDIRISDAENSLVRVAHAKKLMEHGLHEFALINLDSLAKSEKASPAIAFLTAKAAYGAEQYRTAQEILSGTFGPNMENPPPDAPVDFIEMAFPRVHYAETTRNASKYALDPHLVWAVIRQESRYDASAISPSGALGLMQVTPGAAGITTQGSKIQSGAIANILEPKQNLAIGIRLLAKNFSVFGGKLVPAVASYNADMRKVREWLTRNGKMTQDEFIDNIPFQETRTYVKKVLAGYRAYDLLHKKKDLAGLW